MEEFRGRLVSVIGAARSGLDVARVLTQLGAEALLSDSQSAECLGPQRLAEMEATGARWTTSGTPEKALSAGTELVVTSPGVPGTAAVLLAAVAQGIPVWSEIEFAFGLRAQPEAARY